MKRTVLLSVLAGVACIASGMLGYRSGRRIALVEEAATFALTLGALQNIQAGDKLEAIRGMESICFSAAASLISDVEYRERVRVFLPSLIAYRAAYRTNEAEWTPTEQRLETLIRQKQ